MSVHAAILFCTVRTFHQPCMPQCACAPPKVRSHRCLQCLHCPKSNFPYQTVPYQYHHFECTDPAWFTTVRYGRATVYTVKLYRTVPYRTAPHFSASVAVSQARSGTCMRSRHVLFTYECKTQLFMSVHALWLISHIIKEVDTLASTLPADAAEMLVPPSFLVLLLSFWLAGGRPCPGGRGPAHLLWRLVGNRRCS